MKRLAIFACLLLVIASYTHAQSSDRPTIGWIVDGDLWLAGENLEPFQYTTGAFCCALFSPDGSKVVYKHTAEEGLTSAIIFRTDSPQETVMIATPNDFTPNSLLPYTLWRNEDQLVLTTFGTDALGGMRYDLWQIDTAKGEVIEVREREKGGRPYPEPGGDRLVIENPGWYGQQPAYIEILDNDFQTLARYEYPALSAATDFASPWLPEIKWLEDSIRFVIPPRDLIYDLTASTPSKIIEMDMDGTVRELGEIHMNLLLRAPRWSPDGNQVAFVRYSEESPELFDLVIWDVAQQTETLIRESVPGYISLMGWNEDYLIFVEGTDFTNLVLWSPEDQMLEFSNLLDVAVMPGGEVVIARGSGESYDILLIREGQTIPIAENIQGDGYSVELAQY